MNEHACSQRTTVTASSDAAAADVELLLEQLDSLPTLSSIAVRILQLTSDDDFAADEVISLVESDPALASRVLKLCRCHERGRAADVTTVQRAVLLLGFDAVRSTVLSLQVLDIFDNIVADIDTDDVDGASRSAGEAVPALFDPRIFWQHSLAVAVMCEHLAAGAKVSGKPVKPSEAFITGLMHDLGLLALFVIQPRQMHLACHYAEANGVSIDQACREVIGMDSHTAGKRLAEHWNLPHVFGDTMWLHGQPLEAIPELDHRNLIALVSLADAVVMQQYLSPAPGLAMPISTEPLLAALDIDPAHVATAAEQLSHEVAEHAELLGMDQVGDDRTLATALTRANAALGRMNTRLREQARLAQRQSRMLDVIAGFHRSAAPGASVLTVLGQIVQSAGELFDGSVVASLYRSNDRAPWKLLQFGSDGRVRLSRVLHRTAAQKVTTENATTEGHGEPRSGDQGIEASRHQGIKASRRQGSREQGAGSRAEEFGRQQAPAAAPSIPQSLGDSMPLQRHLPNPESRIPNPEHRTPNTESQFPTSDSLSLTDVAAEVMKLLPLLERARGESIDPADLRLLPLPCGWGTQAVLLHNCQLTADDQDQQFHAISSTWGAALAAAGQHEGARRLGEQLAESNRVLLETQGQLTAARTLASIGEIAAGAAHEMNNPLTVICGRSQLLASRLENLEHQRMARQIADHAATLSDMITALRQFAEPAEPDRQATDIRRLLEQVIAACRERLLLHHTAEPQSSQSFTTEGHGESWNRETGSGEQEIEGPRDQGIKGSREENCSDNHSQVPEPSPHRPGNTLPNVRLELSEQVETVFIDPNLFAEALFELIVNAMESAGSREICVFAEISPVDGRLMLQVKDDGQGLSEHVRVHAFDPFFSAKPAGRQPGLGLARVRRIVEAHGGQVTLENNSNGAGAVATIRLHDWQVPRPSEAQHTAA